MEKEIKRKNSFTVHLPIASFAFLVFAQLRGELVFTLTRVQLVPDSLIFTYIPAYSPTLTYPFELYLRPPVENQEGSHVQREKERERQTERGGGKKRPHKCTLWAFCCTWCNLTDVYTASSSSSSFSFHIHATFHLPLGTSIRTGLTVSKRGERNVEKTHK